VDTSTIIAAHQKAIKVLELIEQANLIIEDSEKYARSHKKYMQPVVDYHLKQVSAYQDRQQLQDYYINLKYRLIATPVNIAYTADFAMPF
jgi:hypothetical protein